MFSTKQMDEMDNEEANNDEASSGMVCSENSQASYKCTVCANVYDPAKNGDGVAFDDLPESWTCPVCGQLKACMEFHQWISAADNSKNGGRLGFMQEIRRPAEAVA